MRSSKNNRDRYGYVHRQDQAHDVGDAKPGDSGSSQGTYHDQEMQGQNVIFDGKVRPVDSECCQIGVVDRFEK